ncbi:aldo/keto reductase [Candidatus Puniceispirillum sp.]|jgi:aryl-alcohol dehydrogenase-like predicted oxidoreductase|nr:aldo/keto reductase [Alphaproteobacteria bacterium]MDC1293606.1 aldo/keto reductase [Candidatus Puniceispirillum sp.]
MGKRSFSNTGLAVSWQTFGCGAVGGLMTEGDSGDQNRAITWARHHSIIFFDTATSYGNGIAEENLGRALNGNSDGLVVLCPAVRPITLLVCAMVFAKLRGLNKVNDTLPIAPVY